MIPVGRAHIFMEMYENGSGLSQNTSLLSKAHFSFHGYIRHLKKVAERRYLLIICQYYIWRILYCLRQFCMYFICL